MLNSNSRQWDNTNAGEAKVGEKDELPRDGESGEVVEVADCHKWTWLHADTTHSLILE